jgi:hypothetical protein
VYLPWVFSTAYERKVFVSVSNIPCAQPQLKNGDRV